MRKSQRAITDRDEMIKLLASCRTMRLAVNGDGFPYIVPLSYGFKYTDGKLKIYFHCAKEGRKTDLIGRDNRVCIEVDELGGYAETGHSVTADYKSLIMTGIAERAEGAEAAEGLKLLLEHCGVKGYSAEECAARDLCAVYRVDVIELSGKKRF